MKRFLFDIKTFWIETWKTNKLVFFIEMICTIMGLISSTMINVGSKDPNMFPILLLYCISAIGWVYTSYYRRNTWLVVLMGYYALISIVGMVNLLL